MADDLIEQLRASIDAKHDQAVQALETIRAYLDEVPLGANGPPRTLAKRRTRARRRAPIREQVLGIIGERTATVDQMVAETGFKRLQVRGVLNAPDIKDRVDRWEDGGVMHYKLKEAETQKTE